MAIVHIIEKLRAVSENPEGKISLYFTRKDNNGKYSSYNPGTSIALKREFMRIIMDALESIKGKDAVRFNPAGSLGDTVEVCSYESVDSFDHIIKSLDEDKLLEEPPEDVAKFTFYCFMVQLGDLEKLFFFRRVIKFKRLQKGIIGRLVTGDFEKIDSDLLGIDNHVDIIGCNSELTVVNHISMERIFDIRTQFQLSARRTLTLIKDTNRIENFEQFEEDSISDGRIIRGLTKILQDPGKVSRCFDNFEKIKELVSAIQLDIRFSADGSKLLYESKDQLQNITLIIRDAYYQAYITERLGVDELA